MVIPGFEAMRELVRDGAYMVYRARRTRDRQPVLLKVPVGAAASSLDDEALEREFDLLRRLEVAGLVRAYELLRTPAGLCLVLEDRGLAPLQQLIAQGPISLDVFFSAMIPLCEVLSGLHRRDVIHGNVSPATIFVDPASGAVELSGLASASQAESGGRTTSAGRAALTYVSPEQTGRMNRPVDYRTDLYSLGATAYEMLAGAPPFKSADALELMHAHIARTPAPLTAVPEQVSRIVLKLLAKTAEERYQSAMGLAHDLGACKREWTEHGAIPLGEIATHDRSDRFVMPQRLYGREPEIELLRRAFDRACEGQTTLLLVSGYSGVGKTALVQELRAPIARRRGYFISGKFDQIVRSIPYGALIHAFRGLVRQLLAESEERLATRRQQLTEALGGNGGVLAEVIPEIELILGTQEPPPPLAPAESQNRFQYVFQRFVGTLAHPQHPLVIALDDLQWADAATLELLHTLMTSGGISHLLVIGAYRDNEVDATHLLTWALDRLQAEQTPIERLALGSLALPDVVQFLADTLHGTSDEVTPLARVILQKTDGNPFFVIQFLKMLRQDGLFEFDYRSGRWTFQMAAIGAARMTDNVIDLMTRKIRRLSLRGQRALTLAACIGDPFARRTFLTVAGGSEDESAQGLREALDAGLLLAVSSSDPLRGGDGTEETYAFLHDRVQQTAYSLIPEQRRAPVHLQIGRQLLAECGGELPDERIFEIVNHFNIGSDLVADEAERLRLARLNLAAARRAKASAAYQAALDYAQHGTSLLPHASWTADHELTRSLHLEAAEAQYLTGHFDAAEEFFQTLIDRAATRLELAEVHSQRIVLRENQSRYAEAVAVGREALALFDITFPDDAAEKDAAIDADVRAITELLGDRPIASLVDLPVADDAEVRMVMRIVTALWASSYLVGDHALTRLISARIVRLSLVYGNTEDSAYGYVTHGITIGPVRGDYQSAYEWGELALAVNDRFADAKRRAKIHQQFHAHVQPWRRPFAACIPHARQACRSGLEVGDFTYAGYGAFTETWPAFLSSRDLERFVREYSPAVGLLERIRMPGLAVGQRVFLSWARALQGKTSRPLSLSHADFDQDAFVAAHGSNPFLMPFFHAAHLHLAVLFDDLNEAASAAHLAQANPLSGTVWPFVVDFWAALVWARRADEAVAAERHTLVERIVATAVSLSRLADNCPENFRGMWLLVQSERRRLEGAHGDAARLADEAIGCASEFENIQIEALGHELRGRLWLQQSRDALAAASLREARRCYAEWGATAKVRRLEERYGPLLSDRVNDVDRDTGAPPPSRPAVEGSLDLATVLKVARAIAGEIELEDLLRRLMQLALENAGADRGAFLQERDGDLIIEIQADANADPSARRQPRKLDEGDRLSHAVVRYVRRTGQDVVVGDAATDSRFAVEAYVQQTGVKSILCVPVMHQGRLSGVLYLENSLTADAFTPERIEIMRILAAQAAISLENTRLYEEMKAEVGRRRHAEQALRDALGELEALKNRLETENVYLQEEIRTQHNFNEIVGNSPSLLDALRRVERVAPTDSTVLIVGETGTGKELFARAIHSRSPRKARPLVKVNCGAIAPGLVESELFGHVKGAFTGAIEKRTGRFEVADGGTIFLDEIGELSLEAQVKLLRVLQEQEFEPVGSSRTVHVDVRVIAATNRDLNQAVKEGKFRADLLYRLNVVPVEVPPLRTRRSDIPVLVAFFVTGLARKLGKPIHGFSSRSMERMMSYDWSGNVRELQNVVERAAVLAQGPILELEDAVVGRTAEASAAGQTGTLDDMQRAHIVGVLELTNGVVEGSRGAAAILGMHPNTLRSRMKKLGIAATRRMD